MTTKRKGNWDVVAIAALTLALLGGFWTFASKTGAMEIRVAQLEGEIKVVDRVNEQAETLGVLRERSKNTQDRFNNNTQNVMRIERKIDDQNKLILRLLNQLEEDAPG